MHRIIFLITTLICISCSKEKSAPESLSPAVSQWIITNVEGPDTGRVNDSIPLTVYWPYASGCDVLDSFVETQRDYEVSIKAFGHTNYGFCTSNAGIKTTTFFFKTSSPGRYELKFLNPDNRYFLYEITIE